MLYQGKLIGNNDPFQVIYAQITETGILQAALRFTKPSVPEYGKLYTASLGIAGGANISEYQHAFDYFHKVLNTELKEVGSLLITGRDSCLNFVSYFSHLNPDTQQWLKPVLTVKVIDALGNTTNEIRSVKPEWFQKTIDSIKPSSQDVAFEYSIHLVTDLQ